jgi:hypothetical protein
MPSAGVGEKPSPLHRTTDCAAILSNRGISFQAGEAAPVRSGAEMRRFGPWAAVARAIGAQLPTIARRRRRQQGLIATCPIFERMQPVF